MPKKQNTEMPNRWYSRLWLRHIKAVPGDGQTCTLLHQGRFLLLS